MLSHNIVTSSASKFITLSCIRCFASRTTQPSPEQVSEKANDDWNKWEFGSFTTRTRKTTEQSNVERSSHCQNKRSLVSRNIDNEWSYLTDDQVEIGIAELKTASTETRIKKLETIIEKRTANIRFVFVSRHVILITYF